MDNKQQQPKISPNPMPTGRQASLQKKGNAGASHFGERGTEGDFGHKTGSLVSRITEQIQSDHIEPRSKMNVTIEQVGYASLVLVLFVFVVLVINWLGFRIRSTGTLDFAQYGPEGYRAMLEALPYGFLLLCLVGLAATIAAIRHYDMSYRRPLQVMASVLVLSIGLGTVLAVSGVNEELAEQADKEEIPQTIVHRLYRGTLTIHHQSTRLIIGPVVEQQPQRLRIAVRAQRLVDIATNDETQYPTGEPMVGDQVRILIIREGNFPLARVILLSQPRPQLTPLTPTSSN